MVSNDEPLAEYLNASEAINNSAYVAEFVDWKASTPVFTEAALFAQDEWRLHPRLTLSLGVRWELDPPPTEKHGDDAYTLLGNMGDPASLSVAPQGTALWKTTWFNFAPRLGVAWSAHNEPGRETVVRAGGGVFFDSDNTAGALSYYDSLGFHAYHLDYGASIPFSSSQLIYPISTAAPYTSSTVVAFPSHLQLPYTLEWNTSVQQALGENQAFTISYVG